MPAPKTSLEFPYAVADLGSSSFSLIEASVSCGFMKYPRAVITFSKAPEGKDPSVDLEEMLKSLKDVDALEEAAKNIRFKMGSGDKSLGFAGYPVSPGFSVSVGGIPGYRVELVHSESDLADLNMGIYRQAQAYNSDRPETKSVAAPPGWVAATGLGDMAGKIADSLMNAFSESSEGGGPDTTAVRKAVHARNMQVVGRWKTFLGSLPSDADWWGASLKGYTSNLLVQLMNVTTLRSLSFTTNLSTFCDMFGLKWYGLPVPEGSLRAISVKAMAEAESYAELKSVPSGVDKSTEGYSTGSGRFPTHVVVEDKASQVFLSDFYRTDSILAKHPETDIGPLSRVVRVAAPMWLPDVRTSKGGEKQVPLSGSPDPGAVKDAEKSSSEKEASIYTSVEKICKEWALIHYVLKSKLPKYVLVTLPLDFSVSPGGFYKFKAGEQSLAGVAWHVEHKVSSVGGPCSTTVELRLAR
jgi:hypothetical protein